MGLPGSGSRKVLRAYALSPQGERQEASSIQDTSVRFRKLDDLPLELIGKAVSRTKAKDLIAKYEAARNRAAN